MAKEQFKNYYVDSSIQFMENCRETEENLCHMVFAEQRLLAMCAARKGKIIASFFPEAADIERQDVFTHLWGYKNILKFNYGKRVEFNGTSLRADRAGVSGRGGCYKGVTCL